MNLNDSPYIGERSNEELQDWVKALQDECAKMLALIDLYDRVEKNNETIIRGQLEIMASRKELLAIRDQQIKMLWQAIDKLERHSINRSTLVALSSN